MPSIGAVIFDLGHTLWDFAPREDTWRLNVLRIHERLSAALGDGLPPPAALDRSFGATAQRWYQSWDVADDLVQPPSDELVREALADLGLAVEEDIIAELTRLLLGAELDMPVVEPDTLAAIAQLDAQGVALGCITNTILLEEGILDALRRLGLLRYLRSVVASSAAGYRKPHASLFQRALRELGVAPQEAVFVGDRLFDDISGAKGIGMRAVLTHQYREEPLDGTAVRPDAVVRRLSELPELLERLSR